jgi:hypothetical protein
MTIQQPQDNIPTAKLSDFFSVGFLHNPLISPKSVKNTVLDEDDTVETFNDNVLGVLRRAFHEKGNFYRG